MKLGAFWRRLEDACFVRCRRRRVDGGGAGAGYPIYWGDGRRDCGKRLRNESLKRPDDQWMQHVGEQRMLRMPSGHEQKIRKEAKAWKRAVGPLADGRWYRIRIYRQSLLYGWLHLRIESEREWRLAAFVCHDNVERLGVFIEICNAMQDASTRIQWWWRCLLLCFACHRWVSRLQLCESRDGPL
ncbi:hypothetical protein EJ06DRAFT_54268 [Trichodelitschia bisporula]|uniref:Uncharacterized protein n=1 Tax=Trichodelitschia bisporula TaxID=703511 RepID=A0A6G1HTW7_9PEZI|nr:hypothetical protein EJ06DRAFT_54268 [Trichodelitschia bisporula]